MANKAQANLRYTKGYGDNFKKLRTSLIIDGKPCTVRQLAEKLLIAYSTISKIESEEREPTIEQVQIYHDFFNVPLDYLTGETTARNTDIVDICNYTGLSQEAIESIKKSIAKYPELRDILNSVLSSYFFEDILGYMNYYKELRNEEVKYHQLFERKGFNIENDLSLEDMDNYREISEKIDMCSLRMHKNIDHIANEITDIHKQYLLRKIERMRLNGKHTGTPE